MTLSDKIADLKYESAPHRRKRMLSMIVDHGFCTITELAVAFEVSEMTIRRDISKLAMSDRSLRVVHGGISAVPVWQSEGTDYRMRAMSNRAIKERIAAEAVRLMVAGSTIALDSGTTAIRIAEAIPSDFHLNVITQSLPVLTALAQKENVEATTLGGTFNRSLQAFVGPGAIDLIANIRIDTFFLSATSVDERGVLAGNDYDAAIKRALVDAADSVVLVSDASKFAVSSRFRVCPLNCLEAFVTDGGISEDQREFVQAAGVRILIASG